MDSNFNKQFLVFLELELFWSLHQKLEFLVLLIYANLFNRQVVKCFTSANRSKEFSKILLIQLIIPKESYLKEHQIQIFDAKPKNLQVLKKIDITYHLFLSLLLFNWKRLKIFFFTFVILK